MYSHDAGHQLLKPCCSSWIIQCVKNLRENTAMNFCRIMFFTGLLITEGNAKVCRIENSYLILERRLPFFEAKSECKKLNKGSLPNLHQQRSKLLQIMHENKIKKIWIGVQRRPMSEWKWVDDTSLKNCQQEIMQYRNFHHETVNRCAVFYIPDQLIKPYPCFSKHICFVCVLPGEAICDNNKYQKCVKRHKYWMTIGTQSQHSNWYSARKQCRQSGGDLVTIDTATKLDDITEEVEKPPNPLDCDKLFIGLRLDHWVDSGPFAEEIPVEERMWLDDEPLNDDDDCAELVIKEDNTTGLKTRDCLRSSRVICTYEKSSEEKVMQYECKAGGINNKMSFGTYIALSLLLPYITFDVTFSFI